MAQQLTPAQFVAKWSASSLSERAASHEHFIDLCRMLGQPTPAELDSSGAEFTFEKGVTTSAAASRGSAGDRGFADVWWRGKFAWEYKRKDKYRDLADAYRQLCQYREALENPPLLVVCDIARTEIHTNFTGTAKEVHTVELADLADPRSLDLLRRVFTDPQSLRPTTTAAGVTEDVARKFAALAQSLRSFGHDPQVAAHFLMKCMFCLFAEDVNLLPQRLFTRLLDATRKDPEKLTERLTVLFGRMRTGGDFGVEPIAYFNGGLFDEAPALRLTAADIDVLLKAADRDWGSVEPAIFGTLFERSLDPNTRAQIGAHYTSRDDIMLIVEPVVMAPLRREWDEVRDKVEHQLSRRRKVKTRKGQAEKAIVELLQGFVHRLSTVRILDPACGSGNFLYVAIQQLLDLEKEVITFAARADIALGLFPQVRPTQLHGIEINPYAAELAQVVIWIGYLQWMRDNGFIVPSNPILEPLQTIECRDAILDFLVDAPPEPPHPMPEPLHPMPEPRRSRREDEPHAASTPHECAGSKNAPEPRRSRREDPHRGGYYLLTWTTYGTWLPGDERGFVGRVPDGKGGHVIHNVPGEPYDADEPRFVTDARRKMRGPAVKITPEQARVCLDAFREVCEKYQITIHAGSIMANHVHLVASSDESEGARLLNLFKGVSSRRLGQRFGKQESGSWWTTGGSKRQLRDEEAFENAVNYVRNQEFILAECEFDPSTQNDPSPGIHAGRSAPEPPRSRGEAELPHSPGEAPSTSGPDAPNPPGVNAGARAVPAQWPDADFIIGNPPFLGSKLFRQQGLDDVYIQAMFLCYDLPNTSDLCCYWFEQARQQLEQRPHVRTGLLATQGIRGGANRDVLKRIKQTGNVFMAWSDRKWILDGAAVHVSIVGFDNGDQSDRKLDGASTPQINSDLTSASDLSTANTLSANNNIAFMGDTKGGPFDIPWDEARRLLAAPNPSACSNEQVVRPWTNGLDITRRSRSMWIIDFDCDMEKQEAAGFAEPFAVVEQRVWPMRKDNRRKAYAERWWIHVEPRPAMRATLPPDRFIATPNLTKFRLFGFIDGFVLPDHQLIAFARSDDYFFGVLHSSIHELWARRMGTQLREAESGFRYTPTTCFETFPLPWPPGSEPGPSPGIHAGRTAPSPAVHGGRSDSAIPGGRTESDDDANGTPPRMNAGARAEGEIHKRISDAAHALNQQRERWLNPPEWIEPIAAAIDTEDDFADVPEDARPLIRHSAIMARAAKDPKLKKRTLTNLYNERPTWLKLAHEALDRAVLASYAAIDPDGGWQEDWAAVWSECGAGQPLPEGHPLAEKRKQIDQQVLANLLRLNLARAKK